MNKSYKTISQNKFKLNNFLVLSMATAAGITVANLYYIQPLLGEIARSFQVSQVSIGFVAMLTQIGYALGMLLILPLADIREKRKLIIIMLICSTCSLLLMFFSFNIFIACFAAFAIGFTSIVPQILVPLAAQLAEPRERGKIIGTVMSGLLIGILLSRTLSGLLAGYFGWRLVYLIAAVMMMMLVVSLRKILPMSLPTSHLNYTELFKSMTKLIKTQPILREASINGAMVFGAFSIFWTSLVFLLESSHFNLGVEAAGLFGLVGITGALAAPIVGRLADKKSPKFTIGIGMLSIILAYTSFFIFGFKLWGLIIGVILLDLGVQSCQISNQARIHALDGEVRNRLNTVYMVSYFAGGALGSFLSSICYSNMGWSGVCVLGLSTQIIAVIFHRRKEKRDGSFR